MQSMVLVILGLKASDNVAFWTYGKKKEKKKRRNLSAWLSKTKSLYLLSKLGYQKKKLSTYSRNLAIKTEISTYSLSRNQTIAYSNKSFILLLLHLAFCFLILIKYTHLMHFSLSLITQGNNSLTVASHASL